MNKGNNNCHPDKKVLITVIFAITMQTAGVIWWAASMDIRVAHLEGDGIMFVTKTECMKNHEIINERMRSTEKLTVRVESSLDRIDSKLDRLIESKNGGR